MKILITGGTGFVGRALCAQLLTKGHELILLVRNPESAKKMFSGKVAVQAWDGSNATPIPNIVTPDFSNIEAVINLAGEPIANGRWTSEVKDRIRDSRVLGTQSLITATNNLKPIPKILISTSAIGWYGDRGDQNLDETSSRGTGFLSDVCQEWEAAVDHSTISRKVILRFGVVLGKGGGALQKMLPPFRLGLGGRIGNGQQYLSWISLNDLCRLIIFTLENHGASGTFNAVSNQPVTNAAFASALGHATHRPTLFPVPAIALKLALGEMAEQTLLASTRVYPKNALALGFKFVDSDLEKTLRSMV